jgi:hypothetical protein
MALWSDTDTLASKPKNLTKKVTFDATTAVNLTNETIDISAGGHMYEIGEPVLYTNGGGTAIGGLTSGTTYFAIVAGQGLIKLATTAANAAAGTAVNLTTGAAGTAHTLQFTAPSVYFEDLTEAGITANRAEGLKTPGWNKYTTYTGSQGETRHKVECLVPMKRTAVAAGDNGDDAILADA